jgi:hypothetical protein
MEEHLASIFRVKKISSARNQHASRWQGAKTSNPAFATFAGFLKILSTNEENQDAERVKYFGLMTSYLI